MTKHFTLAELTFSPTASKRGIDNTPTAEQQQNLLNLCVHVLEPVRHFLREPLQITSGFRSEQLNKVVGGATRNGKSLSQHCEGKAADIVCRGRNAEIFKYLKNLDVDQVIWEFGNNHEPDWVHVSWNGSKNRNEYLKAVKQNGKTQYIKL